MVRPLYFISLLLVVEWTMLVQAIPGLVDLGQSLADKKYPLIKGYFRIEANIIRMENPRGTTKSFMPCDLVPGSCDPKITAAIDYETPNNDFGKDSVPFGNFQTIWEGKGTSVDINKVLSKDVCNHETRKINVRVRAMDKDVISNDTIDRWSCFILTNATPLLAKDERSATWSQEKVCTGHNGSHKITWRYRWFSIPKEECKETAGSSGIIRRNIPGLGK